MESNSVINQISSKIAQTFYPYGDNVWNITGKTTKEKCDALALEIMEMVKKIDK